jgi:dsRNA-specific ribonuclease
MNFTVTTEFSQHKDRSLKDFLVNLLKYVIDEKSLLLYVQPIYMKIWERAFTPESTDPTENYEEDEYAGDRALKATTPIYLLVRNPAYTLANITYIDTLTMEKTTQAKLAVDLGLTHYIRSQDTNISIDGDIYESFFGALYRIANLVSPGIGIIVVYNMHCFIFNQNVIPKEIEEGNDKMIVEQIFIQLALTQPKITTNVNNQLFQVNILLTQEQLDFFNQHDILIKNALLSSATGKSKMATMMNAYKKAKTALNQYGVNNAFINNIKAIRNKDKIAYELVEKEKLVFDIKELVIALIRNVVDKEIHLYTDERAMNVWNDALNNHQEKYQFIGEILLKGLIPLHLVNIYQDNPNYNKETYNNILANITNQYNIFLPEEIYKPLHEKINFESFFGAFFTVSNFLLDGIGFVNTEKLVAFVFADKVPEEFGYKHPKMYFDQLFISFVKQPKLIVKEQHDDTYKYDLYLTEEQLEFLQNEGIHVNSRLIGSAEGQTKKLTEREAYQQARNLLQSFGITESWIRKRKDQQSMADSRLQVNY